MRSGIISGCQTRTWLPSSRTPTEAFTPDYIQLYPGLYSRYSCCPAPHWKVQSMDKFTSLEGVAAPLKIINVDTVMIFPKQYLGAGGRAGRGGGRGAERRD